IGVITPCGTDLKNKFISLEPSKTALDNALADAQKHGAVIAYGQFLTNVVDFLIVAFCIFLMVKLINKLKRAPAPPPPEPTTTEKLLAEIRDTLKERNQRP
ncbi:MAG: mscL, partial [Pedosphaera sp.]|nr:mscL [Pedosphaera sp.]